LGAERGGLVAAAALVSMRLSPSLTSSASAHRALRAVAGAAAGPEITAAAAAAADAADAAASGEDLALAAEARRGAAAAATSAFVDPARPEAASRVEATAEGVFEIARALARVESLDVDEEEGEHEAEEVENAEEDEEVKKAEKAARLGRRVWVAAAAAAEPAVAARTRRCVALSASAALETVNALALEVPAPATREVATALARAALEAAPCAHEDAAASFWLTLGAKIVGNLGMADDASEAYFEALETASDAAAAVVDALVETCAKEAAEAEALSQKAPRPPARRVSSLAALRFLRSESGAAAAPRLVELVELVEGGDADAADARRASASMRLVTSAMACPLASATFAPWLPSLAASATARRATSPEAAALVAALRVAPVGAGAADVPAAVVREVSVRFPRGRRAFRAALAENALRAAETAVAEGSADFDAVAAEAATRLFDAAVRGVDDFETGASKASFLASGGVNRAKHPKQRARPFPTRALSAYALRLSRVFASASGDARGVAVAVAAADAMASLALRYAVAGHAASASVDAAVVTRLCVSVSLASIALPAPPCVAAGVRLATAAGLTSSTRLTAGVAPAVAAALGGAAGASPPEAAAALFSRVLFLTPEAEAEDEDEDDNRSEPNENREGGDSFASGRRSAREPDARAAILDVACGALSALPEGDGVAGSLDEFAILTCALLSWPSIGAAPDAARSRAAVQMVTGLGVAAFGPLAARFAALERGEYSSDSALDSKSDRLETRHRGETASPVTRTHNRHNRRAFFRDACRAMGEAGCTSAQAWAQALRALAAAAATAKSDADARLAAADLLVAWLDARVHAEGKGAWETKALAAAASELVDMDDAALAPACSALASRDVTAEPAAVVDAVLLGELTPHADGESEDVKVRLAPWDPAAVENVVENDLRDDFKKSRAGGTALPRARARARTRRLRGGRGPAEALGPNVAGGRHRRRREPAGGDCARRRAEHAEGIAPYARRGCARARAARLRGVGFRLRLRRRSRRASGRFRFRGRNRADERRRVRRVRAGGRRRVKRRGGDGAFDHRARASGARRRGGATEPSTPCSRCSSRRRRAGREAPRRRSRRRSRNWWVPRVASRLLLSRRERARALRVRVRRPGR
jgi:hypothetical protein